MPERSRFQAILEARCPRCREGKMFVFPAFRIPNFSQMHTHCPHCNLRFEVEPGFFIGAMYISYAMSIAVFVVVAALVYLIFNNPEFYYYMVAIPLMVLILLPVMYRYSRVLFLYGFGGVKHEKEDTHSRLRL